MRVVTLIIATFLLLIGLLSMATPVPGGVVLIAVSLGMIICNSVTAALAIQSWRRGFRRFNNVLIWFENNMGDRFSAPLRRTRPGVPINKGSPCR